MLSQRVDPRVLALIPHRAPMLLINRLVQVSEDSAAAEIDIHSEAPFFEPGKGVPAWIGLEYMGQTAALIAGYQLQRGIVQPHLGFVLGTRRFRSRVAYFPEQTVLDVRCRQLAAVGGSLANFTCEITRQDDSEILVEASLAVMRKNKISHTDA